MTTSTDSPVDLPVGVAPWDSPQVIETRLDLLAAAVEEPLALGTFTDEELAGLDDPTGPPSAPSPWLTGLPAEEAQTAVTAALRGLTARGLYRAIPVDEQEHTFAVEAEPQLLALLTMRRYTSCVVVAERRTAAAVDWTVLYAQRAGLWLAETITPIGLHAFTLATAEAHTESMTAWSGIPGAEAATAPDLDVTLSRDQLAAGPQALEPVGKSTVAITLTRFDIDTVPDDDGTEGGRDASTVRETWSGVFTGPSGCYLSTVTGDAGVRYRGVAAARVREHWQRTLEVIVEEA